MSVERKKRMKRDWAVVLAEFQQSGLTIQAFCRAAGISPSLFYRHRKECHDTNRSARPALGRGDFMAFQAPVPNLSCGFQPAAVLVFGHSIELSIRNECDKELVELLIVQLKGSSC
jgi:hypothetical protein